MAVNKYPALRPKKLTSKKQHLPTKSCPVCGRPFTWRKKWAAVWDEVKYCSERCRRRRDVAQETP